LIDVGLSSNKIKVHPNWIDINEFTSLDRSICRNKIGLNSDDFVVLFLGRMIEKKGVLIMLEVAKKTTKNIKFVFAGDGPLSERVLEESRNNKNIIYLGRIEESEKAVVYNSADLFVAPVLYEEGFATVYLEALACGTPIITSKRGCLPYFLTSQVADFIDKVSVDNVLLALDRHFENMLDLFDKRSVCRKFSEDNFSENNARIILNSYSIRVD